MTSKLTSFDPSLTLPLFTGLFFRCGLSLPHIVAGANLNMPILGSWLQKCGAFFIRRSFGDDALYPVVVKEYIEQLVEQGMNIECFIE